MNCPIPVGKQKKVVLALATARLVTGSEVICSVKRGSLRSGGV